MWDKNQASRQQKIFLAVFSKPVTLVTLLGWFTKKLPVSALSFLRSRIEEINN